MSTVATNEKVTMQDGQLKEYNFRVCFLDPQQGKIAGSFVYDNLGFDKAAILYDVNDDYALGLKDNFVKVFESKGGTIVAEEGYTAGDTDFTAQLTKIKEAQPQIIFTPIFYQDFIMIHKQARTLGIEVPMLGGDGCASEVLFDAAGRRLPQGVCREVQRREDGAQRLHGARRVPALVRGGREGRQR